MTPTPDRLDELLVLDATRGLTPAEATELDALLANFPGADPEGIELAAAAVHRALLGAPEPLPPGLAERLELTAVAFFPSGKAAPKRAPARAWGKWAGRAGWAVAACLAGLLVYTNWPKKELTLAERRRELEPAAAKFAGDRPGAAAEVVWSGEKQEGYLEVRGLPPLDPSKEQYQLWIVDAGRPDKEPVDGGVFDVRPDGTALVRVRPPIRVRDPAAFAITKEAAGGVVVTRAKHELVLTPKAG